MATKLAVVRKWIAHLALLGALVAAVPAMFAQAPTRVLGSITAIDGNHVTVKTAAGDVHQFDIPSSAPIRRIEPGQTSLTNAVTIPLSDLAIGDRLLVLLGANSNGGTPEASEVIAIKHEDVVKRQEQQTQAWGEGEGGLVKSVDPSSGDIVLAAGGGLATKSVTVHTTEALCAGKRQLRPGQAGASLRYSSRRRVDGPRNEKCRWNQPDRRGSGLRQFPQHLRPHHHHRRSRPDHHRQGSHHQKARDHP